MSSSYFYKISISGNNPERALTFTNDLEHMGFPPLAPPEDKNVIPHPLACAPALVTTHWLDSRQVGPFDFLIESSKVYPDLTWYVEQAPEGDTLCTVHQIFRIINGESQRIEIRYGWFRSMTKPYYAPVHHYMFYIDERDAASVPNVARLAEANKVFRTPFSVRLGAWATRCHPQELVKEGVKVVGEPFAITLDEKEYLEIMQHHARDACMCLAYLNKEEWNVIMSHKVARDTERCKIHAYTVIREELEILLTKPDLTSERRQEIYTAIQHPKWTTEWHAWEPEDYAVTVHNGVHEAYEGGDE
jgi:hypothetical protein